MIEITSIINIALRSLIANAMRSFLATLGIIIGVGAVVTMVAIGTGASEKISAQISSMGSNLILILPGATTQGGIRMGAGTQQTLKIVDAEAISKECSQVSAVAPVISGTAQVVFGNQNWSTAVLGTTPDMAIVREWEIVSGRFLTEQDVRSGTKVAVIGQTVSEKLFGDLDPTGKLIRIKKIPFEVVGVLGKKGQSPTGQDQDDIIYVPITTAQRTLFGNVLPGRVRLIYAKAVSLEAIPLATEQIRTLLRQRHRIGQGQEDDFTVMDLTQMLKTAEESTKTMSVLLGAIASVSLIVGGIGIMNIMLVSVTERTREIGIRMAVGAKPKDIRMQFLIESVFLTMIGGVVGLLFGIGASLVVSSIMQWPVSISLFSALIAFSFSAFVGIFFGFYPAYKASSLNPIDALRYE
ncbi:MULTISPECIES: ABC transporter permease [Thermodesulfovibrio]|uniref:ABC transporter permease protein n=2 Tax=Thermodesulfovibrio yellowstonii TaxID=28262 RepID=B5YHF2_THEYD|nr:MULTISPECIES: ABC transporter permease [Thermodesulfovibrio]ACI20665.1 ABC transporter permease protein [Thermodesulfovibrio yellowstonii DSM 11347]MDI6865438.1 ABC transporter permease [Thermodesulfovibrio yellowstonii]GLI52658.1 ABC transporter permease [Thermodesulfovibrio islandicus]